MKAHVRRKVSAAFVAAIGFAGIIAIAAESHEGPQQPWSKYKVHDMSRPAPPVVTPGTPSTDDQPGKPPSDAVVLFDGTDLSHWQSSDGSEPTFTLKNGEMLSANLKNPKNNKTLQSKE